MVKTNSRVARERIRAYIMETAADHMSENEYPAETFKDYAAAILAEYRRQTDGDKRRMTEQERFTDWGQGLTFGGLFDFYYDGDAVDILGDILEETESERNKYPTSKAESLFSYLIYSEVCKAASK